jgi:hypothetical protein
MVQRSPSAGDVVLLPGRLALQAVKSVSSAAIEVAKLPGRVAGLIAGAEAALANLDKMSTGVTAMQDDMKAMRDSLVDVIGVLKAVDGGVGGMTGEVGGIRAATESLDSKIESLQESLVNIDLLAKRLTPFGSARRARREVARQEAEAAATRATAVDGSAS